MVAGDSVGLSETFPVASWFRVELLGGTTGFAVGSKSKKEAIILLGDLEPQGR